MSARTRVRPYTVAPAVSNGGHPASGVSLTGGADPVKGCPAACTWEFDPPKPYPVAGKRSLQHALPHNVTRLGLSSYRLGLRVTQSSGTVRNPLAAPQGTTGCARKGPLRKSWCIRVGVAVGRMGLQGDRACVGCLIRGWLDSGLQEAPTQLTTNGA